MSYYRRGYSWENIQYLIAPTGGWNPDGNPWELPESHAVVLDNALVRPGRVAVRGSLTNWSDLSAITSPGPPLNVCGVQPLPGSGKLAVSRKLVSPTAYVDPWFAPIVRPTSASGLGFPNALLTVASGSTVFSQNSWADHVIPGPRGINFEGSRYYISYGGVVGGASSSDAGGTYFATATVIGTLSSVGTPTPFLNAPRGFIDIKGYQSRIWGLGGVDSPGGGTTFNPLGLFFTNPIGPGGGNAAAFADWKDPVSGLTNKILMDGDTTDPGIGLATVRGGLLIFRQNSLWILRGSTTSNYVLTPVSRQVGCVDPRSIVETDKGVYFVSTQGLMVTDGVTVRNVSGVAMHTLQSAVQVVTASILAFFGGYITAAVTSAGQLVISMGIASATALAPDGHIQPVWCGMFDPDTGSWTRITSALFASDGVIIVPGNNYPGWVFTTPDERLLSIGDKYITQWEATSQATNSTSLSAGPASGTVVDNASFGGNAWATPANAQVSDGVFTASSIGVTTGSSPAGTVTQNNSDSLAGIGPGSVAWSGSPLSSISLAPNQTSEALRFTGLGFAIPADAVVTGMSCVATYTTNTGAGASLTAAFPQLVVGGSLVSEQLKGSSFGVGVTGGTANFNNNQFFVSGVQTPFFLTAAQVNASNFGVEFIFDTNGASGFTLNLSIASVSVTLYYTRPTHNLQMTGLGFSIPSTATIAGFQVSATRKSASGYVQDAIVQLSKASAATGTNKSAGAAWPTIAAAATFGGSSDLWGATWTPADVNGSGFGVIIAGDVAQNSTTIGGTPPSDTASVDVIQITVYFTLSSIVHQQSFVRSPALYDLDAAGAFQPIPFRWLTRWFPVVGTTTLTRKFGQMKRWFCDYVFQGIGLPSANGFTAKPVDASSILIPGAAPVQLPPTDNSMTNSSVSGGQPNATTSIERSNADLPSEISDLAFDISFIDTAQVTQPSFVAAELYGVGIEYQPGRDLK